MALAVLAVMAVTGFLAVRVILNSGDKKEAGYDFTIPKPAQETPALPERSAPAGRPRPELPAARPQPAGKDMPALPSVAPETTLNLYSKTPAAFGRPGAGRTAGAPGGRPGPAPSPAQPAWDGRKKKRTMAEQYYFSLLHKPQYRASPAIQSWKKEFLACPDLSAINHTYHQTGDAFRFLTDVAKSSSFQRLLGRYLGSTDVQGFITDMAASPSVKSSANQYMAASDDLRRMGQVMGYATPQGAATLPRR